MPPIESGALFRSPCHRDERDPGFGTCATAVRTASARTESPRVASASVAQAERRYRVVQRLGSGSQGVVYLAKDVSRDGDEQPLSVLKIAWRREASRLSIVREAEVLRALRGSRFVPELIGTLSRAGSMVGLAMRHEHGRTLDRFIEDHGTRGRLRGAVLERLAVEITAAVLDVLERGYLHRDLKPSHVLVAPRGDRVWLLDFGLACTRESEAPREISGTFAYASPEQLAAEPLDAKSDLFALGVILHELATGRPFFTRDDVMSWQRFLEVRSRRLRREIALTGIDRRLARLIRRLLVVDPAIRADVEEVAARLEEIRRRG